MRAIGRVIGGRFRLDSVLGRGGAGEVWRATQLNLMREVALKMVLPEDIVMPETMARFQREARVASQLRHPNAVEIYDFGVDEGTPWIAMELLAGAPLRTLVGPEMPLLPLPRVCDITQQVASVLVAAHAIGLVHRDLKPENVFVERSRSGDRVTVVDFGLALLTDLPGGGRLSDEFALNGTPEYISPEQIDGNISTATDIYAFGCMLYELLTGDVPFTGNPVQLLTQHAVAIPTPPSERRNAPLPPDLEALTMRMLRKDPSERPRAEEIEALAREFADSASAPRKKRGSLEPGPTGRTSMIPPPTDATKNLELAVIGRLPGNMVLELAGGRIDAFIVQEDQPPDGADVIFAPGATNEELTALCSRSVPVLTDAAASDVEHLRDLLRLGVADVIVRPIQADELTRKVWRAVQKARRGRPT